MEGAICNSVLGDGFRWIGWLLDAAGEGSGLTDCFGGGYALHTRRFSIVTGGGHDGSQKAKAVL